MKNLFIEKYLLSQEMDGQKILIQQNHHQRMEILREPPALRVIMPIQCQPFAHRDSCVISGEQRIDREGFPIEENVSKIHIKVFIIFNYSPYKGGFSRKNSQCNGSLICPYKGILIIALHSIAVVQLHNRFTKDYYSNYRHRSV